MSFVAGALRADAFAKWNRLSINVGEDEVELLEAHDQEVKAMILGVEKSLLGALAKHDGDIKAELAIIKPAERHQSGSRRNQNPAPDSAGTAGWISDKSQKEEMTITVGNPS